MGSDSTHVVLGTGALGMSVVRILENNEEEVRAMNRSGEAAVPDSVEVMSGDLTEATDAQRVCEGASVVYFCVQPPYTEWPQRFPPAA